MPWISSYDKKSLVQFFNFALLVFIKQEQKKSDSIQFVYFSEWIFNVPSCRQLSAGYLYVYLFCMRSKSINSQFEKSF